MPQTINDAVASPAGLRQWWAAGAHGSDYVGGIIHVAFREDNWLDMRIDQLKPGGEVRWSCVAQHEPGFAQLDEWVGTTVSFHLEPASDETSRCTSPTTASLTWTASASVAAAGAST